MEDLLPSQIQIKTKNFMSLNVKQMKFTETRGLVILKIKQLKAKFTDLHFSWDRKVIPRAKDSGTADVDMSKGRGMFVKIIYKITESKEGILALHLDTVTCKIDSLTIKVKKSHHNILENLAISLFSTWVKNSVAESIVNAIVETILPMEDSINGIFKEISISHFVENANEKLHEVFEKGTEAEPIKTVKNTAMSTLEGAKQAVQTVAEVVSNVPEKIEKATEKIAEKIPETTHKISEKIPELPRPSEMFSQTSDTQFLQPIGNAESIEQQPFYYPEVSSSGSITWYSRPVLLGEQTQEISRESLPSPIITPTDEILHKSFGGGVMVVGEPSENIESSEEESISEMLSTTSAQGAFTGEKKESEIISESLQPAEKMARLETHVVAPKESQKLPLRNPPVNEEKEYDRTTQVGFSHDESKIPYYLNPDDVLTLPKEEKKPEEKLAK